MGKNLVVVGFLVCCGLAIYVLVTRGEPDGLSESIHENPEPRISLEDFTLYKYKGHKADATVSGKLALFMDPNMLEVYGSVRGLRHNSEKREFMSAESATIFFETSGLAELMVKEAKVAKAEIEDNVNIGVKYNRLKTEFAELLPEKGILQSELPVSLKGPTGDFRGEKGFRYFLNDEKVKIFGPINGVMQGAIIDNRK